MLGSPNPVSFVYDGDGSDSRPGRPAGLGRDRGGLRRVLPGERPADAADRLRRPLGLRAVHRPGHPGRRAVLGGRGAEDRRRGGGLRRHGRRGLRPLLSPGLRRPRERRRGRRSTRSATRRPMRCCISRPSCRRRSSPPSGPVAGRLAAAVPLEVAAVQGRGAVSELIRFPGDPFGSRLDVGRNGAACTSRICPSTNPRAPACPRQARSTRPPRQARADYRPTVMPGAPRPPRSRAPADEPARRNASPTPVRDAPSVVRTIQRGAAERARSPASAAPFGQRPDRAAHRAAPSITARSRVSSERRLLSVCSFRPNRSLT